ASQIRNEVERKLALRRHVDSGNDGVELARVDAGKQPGESNLHERRFEAHLARDRLADLDRETNHPILIEERMGRRRQRGRDRELAAAHQPARRAHGTVRRESRTGDHQGEQPEWKAALKLHGSPPATAKIRRAALVSRFRSSPPPCSTLRSELRNRRTLANL